MTQPHHHVTPGGDPIEIHSDDDAVISKLSVGTMDNNAYLVRAGDQTLLVDAAADPGSLLRLVGDHGPDVVVTTHRHHDHIAALEPVADSRSPQLFAGEPDVAAIEAATGVSGTTGVWDGDRIRCGAVELEVIGLIGHTPGAIALGYRDMLLFTGDSLFPGGPGKTGSAAEFTSLMDDLEHKVFSRYGDDVAVHPGHGDSTTLGAERPHLASWRERGW